jgi:four helix bundle protein
MIKEVKKFDLEERTAKFGEKIIEFCKTIPQDTISRPLIGQIVRSGTSVGANYMEANGGNSKKEFKNRISICRKEISETKHWLRMIAKTDPKNKAACIIIWREAQELTLIFGKILSTLKY